MPKCEFGHVELKKNRKARIKVHIKNGWGVVIWTKEEDFNLHEGLNLVIIEANSKELE
jgi:hypothetical protein